MKKTIRISSEKEIDEAIIKASNENNGSIIAAYGRFGKLTISIYNHQPRTDTPDTIQTYQTYGGFYKNGSVINPTKTWLDKYNRIPLRNY